MTSATTTWPGCALPRRSGRHQNVLADALVLRDQEPDAAILVEPADDFPVRARNHVDDRSLRAAAPVDADRPRRRPVAVQHLAHFRRRQEQVGAAVVGEQKTEAVGMTLHRAGHEVELGDHAQLALAIGHELAVALHRSEPSGKGLALGRAVDAQRGRQLVGAHRRAALAQEFQNALARRNVDVVAPLSL